MTTGQKIHDCRKRAGMTQEELAEKLGVTRQAVSKWEADAAFPETENILELCRLFHVSSDELLFGGRFETPVATEKERAPEEGDGRGRTWGVIDHGDKRRFEYISKRRILGLPLLHVHFGLGVCRAHGIFAFGNFASGFVSAGFFSVGFLAVGIFALGLVALGNFVLACLAMGSIAAGVLAFGGISVGVMSFGGLAVGQIAVGGAAIGQYAVGDWANGWLAIGRSHADGAHAFLVPDMLDELKQFLETNVGANIGRFLRIVVSGQRS